jgi:hypothetical protein
MRALCALAPALLTAGCGVVASFENMGAREDYRKSSAEYRQCLEANASTPQRCEGLRILAETDSQKYQTLVGTKANINVSGR